MYVPESSTRTRRISLTAEDKLLLILLVILPVIVFALMTPAAPYVVPCILATLLSLDLYRTFLKQR